MRRNVLYLACLSLSFSIMMYFNNCGPVLFKESEPSRAPTCSGDQCPSIFETPTPPTESPTATPTPTPTPTPIQYELEVEKKGDGLGKVTSLPGGLECGDGVVSPVCKLVFLENTPVTLTAVAQAGSLFKEWKGDCKSITVDKKCELIMDGKKKVQAEFEKVVIPQKPILTLKKVNSPGNVIGSGRVDSTPNGISCGPQCNVEAHEFDLGSQILLKADPSPGSEFVNFKINGNICTEGSDLTKCTVSNFIADLEVQAEFRIPPTITKYQLTTEIEGTGQGQITGTGIVCPGDCTEEFNPGDMVALTATAQNGSTFTGWSEAGCTTPVCNVTMNDSKTVKANFIKAEVPKESVLPNLLLNPSFDHEIGNLYNSKKGDLGWKLVRKQCPECEKIVLDYGNPVRNPNTKAGKTPKSKFTVGFESNVQPPAANAGATGLRLWVSERAVKAKSLPQIYAITKKPLFGFAGEPLYDFDGTTATPKKFYLEFWKRESGPSISAKGKVIFSTHGESQGGKTIELDANQADGLVNGNWKHYKTLLTVPSLESLLGPRDLAKFNSSSTRPEDKYKMLRKVKLSVKLLVDGRPTSASSVWFDLVHLMPLSNQNLVRNGNFEGDFGDKKAESWSGGKVKVLAPGDRSIPENGMKALYIIDGKKADYRVTKKDNYNNKADFDPNFSYAGREYEISFWKKDTCEADPGNEGYLQLFFKIKNEGDRAAIKADRDYDLGLGAAGLEQTLPNGWKKYKFKKPVPATIAVKAKSTDDIYIDLTYTQKGLKPRSAPCSSFIDGLEVFSLGNGTEDYDFSVTDIDNGDPDSAE